MKVFGKVLLAMAAVAVAAPQAQAINWKIKNPKSNAVYLTTSPVGVDGTGPTRSAAFINFGRVVQAGAFQFPIDEGGALVATGRKLKWSTAINPPTGGWTPSPLVTTTVRVGAAVVTTTAPVKDRYVTAADVFNARKKVDVVAGQCVIEPPAAAR